MSIARSLENVEGCVQDEMALLVHVPHRPITQLAVVDDPSMSLLAVSEGKGPAGELRGADALHLAFAHRSHGQRVAHDRFEKARGIDCSEEALWKWRFNLKGLGRTFHK